MQMLFFETRELCVSIGVPKEIKADEYRVVGLIAFEGEVARERSRLVPTAGAIFLKREK